MNCPNCNSSDVEEKDISIYHCVNCKNYFMLYATKDGSSFQKVTLKIE